MLHAAAGGESFENRRVQDRGVLNFSESLGPFEPPPKPSRLPFVVLGPQRIRIQPQVSIVYLDAEAVWRLPVGKILGRIAKLRLEQAKAAVADRNTQTSTASRIDRERVRGKLAAMRSGAGENVAGVMMAARKGKNLSEKDEEGTLDDLAQLEALENEGNDEE